MNTHALIVDNDGQWRDLLARAVRRAGLRDVSASTPLHAIELIRERPYAIVLLDADLGAGQGTRSCTEVLAELKARRGEVPTIIVSGLDHLDSFVSTLQRHYRLVSSFSKEGSMLVLDNLIRDVTGIVPATTAALGATDLGELADHLEYVFSFMKIDIVEHSAIYAYNRTPDIDATLDAFEEFVELEIKNSQGHILSWQGDGGLAAFFAGDKTGNCGTAALSLLYKIREFNYDRNKTKEAIKIRIACHKGTAKYRSNHGRIHSAAINFVCHLEAKGTASNAISISKFFYDELHEKLRKSFNSKGKFEGIRIFEHRLA
jgi:class 3 adenylate cyclase